MKASTGGAARTRSKTQRATLADMDAAEGDTLPPRLDIEDEPEMSVQEAAYALYVARGCVDGHDLEDWLAAEAALMRETPGRGPGTDH